MPAIAPIGVRVDKYLDVPDFAKGADVDPAKGYRIQKLGDGLYMVTDGGYQSMFMTYEEGVVVIDAPPSYAAHIREAIAEVTSSPITHVVYSHAHTDHIGGVNSLGGRPVIIAQAETNRLLARDNDPNRPLATVTFDNEYRLVVGSQVLELSYHGNAHVPGNIFIYAPKQRTLMVVDVIFPGLDAVAPVCTRTGRTCVLRAGKEDQQVAVRHARGWARCSHRHPRRRDDATRVHGGAQGRRRDCPEDDRSGCRPRCHGPHE